MEPDFPVRLRKSAFRLSDWTDPFTTGITATRKQVEMPEGDAHDSGASPL
jgi:hypothetical protein